MHPRQVIVFVVASSQGYWHTPGHSTRVPGLLQTENLSLLLVVCFLFPQVEARVHLLLIYHSLVQREYVRRAGVKPSGPENMVDDALSSFRCT